MGIFGRSRAANSAIFGQIKPKFELVQDLMVVLLTSKNEKDSIEHEGGRELTRLYIEFSDAQGLTPQTVMESRRYSNSSKLLLVPLLEDPIKIKALEC